MADRLVVMDRGKVRQIGTAEELYERPADAFVAGFIGRCNLLRGEAASGGFRTEDGTLLPAAIDGAPRGPLLLALRPERIVLSPGEGLGVQGRLLAATYLGAQTEWLAEVGGARLSVAAATPLGDDPRRRLAPGDAVALNWDPAAVRLLPAGRETGET